MEKAEALARWENLPEGQNPLPHMTPIPYKAEGSKFGACGVRIDGNPEFVDAVLSCLKTLLPGENGITRLDLQRTEVKPTKINGQEKHFVNTADRAEVCYVRLWMRGREAAMMSGFAGAGQMGRDKTRKNTEAYARTLGLDLDE